MIQFWRDINNNKKIIMFQAAIYSKATGLRIAGVEMNSDLCQLQSAMVEKYHLNNFAKVWKSMLAFLILYKWFSIIRLNVKLCSSNFNGDLK